MSDKNTGGPAFPSHGTMGEVTCEGMTLREYFAAHAPITMSEAELAIKAIGEVNYTGEQIMKMLCTLRWLYADTMLEARQS